MTAPVYAEGFHAGEFMVSEENGRLSRDGAIIAMGAKHQAGEVMGQILFGTAANVAGTNTGNGAMTGLATSPKALVGGYKWQFTKAASGAGDFEVIDPNNEVCGIGTAGVAFTGGGLTFTLAVGGTNWAVGDSGTVTVSAGSGKWVQMNLSGTDGSQHAGGILLGGVDATLADMPGTIVNFNAEVNANMITWPTGINPTQQAVAVAELRKLGIKLRS